MATDFKDLGETIRDAVGNVAREAVKSVSSNGRSRMGNGDGGLSGARGVAAGAALAAAAPLVAKGAGKVVKGAVTKRLGSSGGASGNDAGGAKQKVTDNVKNTVGKGVKDTVGKKIDEAGGASGVAKEAGKGMLPGVGGGGDKGKKGTPGVGKGRRMPLQQAVDVAAPLSTVYNQWTQFEEWPQFMHRLDQATQEDDCNVSFRTKIWGMSREFEAQIVEQRPDERIMWTVGKGVTHNGVVTFHELADRLTRVQVTLDVEPGSLLEKAARGMRHVKRAVRADLARFKAFTEMQEVETGAWRGVIEDGEVVDPHDDSYDEERDYSEVEDVWSDESGDDEDASGGEEDEDQDDDSQQARTQRFKRQAQTTRSGGGSSSRSSSGSSSSSSRGGSSKTKSSGGRSRSAATSKSKSSRSSGGSSSNGRSGSSAKRSTSSSSKSSSPKRKSTTAKS